MKHHLAKLLSGFLAVCLLAGSALAALMELEVAGEAVGSAGGQFRRK